MTKPGTSTAEYFEAKYRAQPDPWSFAHSSYELSRYDAIIAAVAHRRYERVFEPGCSIGVLTERLAALSRSTVAIDFSATAVAQAAARCAHLAGVEVHCDSIERWMPLAGFDLVVLSEIGYYFGAEEWRSLCSEMVDGMDRGSTLIAAHWLGHSEDHQMGGDEVHAILGALTGLELEHSERHPEFRIGRWVRR